MIIIKRYTSGILENYITFLPVFAFFIYNFICVYHSIIVLQHLNNIHNIHVKTISF